MKSENLNIVDALVQLSFLVQQVLGRVAAGHDLSLIQVRLLGILRDREPSMAELAAWLDLDKSSITGLVDRAEKRGLVRRTPSDHDRRAIHVGLSAKGRMLAETFTRQMEKEVRALSAHLGEAATAKLAALAGQVVQR